MNASVKAGVILAVLVTVVSAIVMATGLHQHFMLFGLITILVYILLNIVLVYMTLNKSAADNSYGAQLMSSAVLGLVGGVLIFIGSWVLLSMVFPDALAEIRDSAIAFMENSSMSEDMIEEQMVKLDSATPVSQSLPGLIGTFTTSVVVGAIVAIFKRKK